MHTKDDGMGRLEEVRRQFEDWRRTRERRTWIPEPLWRVAAEAAAMSKRAPEPFLTGMVG